MALLLGVRRLALHLDVDEVPALDVPSSEHLLVSFDAKSCEGVGSMRRNQQMLLLTPSDLHTWQSGTEKVLESEFVILWIIIIVV